MGYIGLAEETPIQKKLGTKKEFKTIIHHQWRYSPDRALAYLTGFMIVIIRCELSAPRSTRSTHPDSAIRDI
jgi:hypothetical protein